MSAFELSAFAVPAVLCLITFLSFSSQYLLSTIAPGPLTTWETVTFNILNISLLICYARTCLTSPWIPDGVPEVRSDKSSDETSRRRWCRKCQSPKLPRAHHCKVCKRCIPKMDHHCPWTANCVSHFTFPHFIRFLVYAVSAMACLEYFLYLRVYDLWENRMMPSYLGPSAVQMTHLLLLVVTNSLTLFMLAILLLRSIWSLVVNTYTIEGWEIDRHDAVLRRARYLGGFLDGPDGSKVRIVRQEFPYDIGFWGNLKQGMGTGNVFAWLWPFATSPAADSASNYETNGFEDPKIGWPPPDPDRMPRINRSFDSSGAFIHQSNSVNDIEAFRERQERDLQRQANISQGFQRRKPFSERFTDDIESTTPDLEDYEDGEGEEGWRNPEGDRLGDFGVDEDVEFYDEGIADDDVPLAELLRRGQFVR